MNLTEREECGGREAKRIFLQEAIIPRSCEVLFVFKLLCNRLVGTEAGDTESVEEMSYNSRGDADCRYRAEHC